MRSMVFSLLMLYTSRLRAGWSYQHTTLRKQTSCHPWHHRTVIGHHSRHVAFFFKACLSGNMKAFCIVQHHVFILNSLPFFLLWIVLSIELRQGTTVKENGAASFHIFAKVLLMQELKTQWKLVTELIHTYLCVTRTSQVTAWVTCLLSRWNIVYFLVCYFATDAGQSTDS